MEQTFFIIKPDGMEYFNEILEILKENNFNIIKTGYSILDRNKLDEHYNHIKNEDFYPNVVEYMTSSKVLYGILEKENAVEDFRKLMGATNPELADENTLRNKYGKIVDGKIYNVCHGSDSVVNAKREIGIWL